MIILPAHVRSKPVRGSLRRLLYRAEQARDWEPRLDHLWGRSRHSYQIAVVRDAEHALRKFAGHPTIRHHRFLILPRFSGRAVGFAVFADDGSDCCWLDLVWDHDHPGALELLAGHAKWPGDRRAEAKQLIARIEAKMAAEAAAKKRMSS